MTGPPPRRPGPIRVATSRNRPPTVLWWLRDVLDIELIGIGSAGAKAMAVVRGAPVRRRLPAVLVLLAAEALFLTLVGVTILQIGGDLG